MIERLKHTINTLQLPVNDIDRQRIISCYSDLRGSSYTIHDILESLIELSTNEYNEDLIKFFYFFCPSCQTNHKIDTEFVFLHNIDLETRQLDKTYLNTCLKYCLKAVNNRRINITAPIIDLLIDCCVKLSGIYDLYGFSYIKNQTELDIYGGFMIETLEVFDRGIIVNQDNNEDTDYPSQIITKIFKILFIFFDKSIFKVFLDQLTVKDDDNEYNLEILWLNHESEFKKWGHLKNLNLLLELKKFMLKKNILPHNYLVKVNIFDTSQIKTFY